MAESLEAPRSRSDRRRIESNGANYGLCYFQSLELERLMGMPTARWSDALLRHVRASNPLCGEDVVREVARWLKSISRSQLAALSDLFAAHLRMRVGHDREVWIAARRRELLDAITAERIAGGRS